VASHQRTTLREPRDEMCNFILRGTNL